MNTPLALTTLSTQLTAASTALTQYNASPTAGNAVALAAALVALGNSSLVTALTLDPINSPLGIQRASLANVAAWRAVNPQGDPTACSGQGCLNVGLVPPFQNATLGANAGQLAPSGMGPDAFISVGR